MPKINIRERKAHLCEIVERVRAGEAISRPVTGGMFDSE
jgi:antitoxin (DNA-binding transcriptional repressor) of toxin-antitoxin stability system